MKKPSDEDNTETENTTPEVVEEEVTQEEEAPEPEVLTPEPEDVEETPQLDLSELLTLTNSTNLDEALTVIRGLGTRNSELATSNTTLQNQVTQLTTQNSELQSSINELRNAERTALIRSELETRKITYIEQALTLASNQNIDLFTFNEDGSLNTESFESAVTTLKQNNPFLVGGGTNSNNNGDVHDDEDIKKAKQAVQNTWSKRF